MDLKVKRLAADAVLPRYAHEGDAGLDVFSSEAVEIAPGESASVPTGIVVELPPGTEAQIRPRSGLAARHRVTVLNAPGTIDAGYRGELRVLLINHGRETFRIDKGMRVAQMIVAPVLRADVREVEEVSETARGAGGFGSTGLGARGDKM